jgi:hypothetical protein
MIHGVNRQDQTAKLIRWNPWYQQRRSRFRRNRKYLVFKIICYVDMNMQQGCISGRLSLFTLFAFLFPSCFLWAILLFSFYFFPILSSFVWFFVFSFVTSSFLTPLFPFLLLSIFYLLSLLPLFYYILSLLLPFFYYSLLPSVFALFSCVALYTLLIHCRFNWYFHFVCKSFSYFLSFLHIYICLFTSPVWFLLCFTDITPSFSTSRALHCILRTSLSLARHCPHRLTSPPHPQSVLHATTNYVAKVHNLFLNYHVFTQCSLACVSKQSCFELRNISVLE